MKGSPFSECFVKLYMRNPMIFFIIKKIFVL